MTNTKNISLLNQARTAKKVTSSSYCGIVKQLYALADDDTEEAKFLKSFLPKDKKALLDNGAVVCEFGNVGKSRISATGKEYTIKISADIVLRFVANLHKEAALMQAKEEARKKDEARAKAKEEKRAKAKAEAIAKAEEAKAKREAKKDERIKQRHEAEVAKLEAKLEALKRKKAGAAA